MTEFALRFGPHRLAGYRTGSGTPLLLVHGGPGVPCGYVYEAHAHYAAEGFEVVSWAQPGCGRSDRPNDPSLWNVARFVDEVEEVRRQLGWDRFILMGNSWGGMLGIEYCLRQLDRVCALVIGNSAASMPRLIRGFDRVKAALGSDTVRLMALREADGTTDHPEYMAARTLLMHRHMCRCERWPRATDARASTSLGAGDLPRLWTPAVLGCGRALLPGGIGVPDPSSKAYGLTTAAAALISGPRVLDPAATDWSPAWRHDSPIHPAITGPRYQSAVLRQGRSTQV